MQAAAHTARALARSKYDLTINAGIAGTFRDSIEIRQVVVVQKERLSDLGAEDGEQFLDITEMGLLDKHAPKYNDGWLESTGPALPALEGLSRVSSITVNRVIGSERTLAYVTKSFDPDVVNMEGAAFFYAAAQEGVPALSIRSISDRVKPFRDKSSWDIKGAITSLNNMLREILSR